MNDEVDFFPTDKRQRFLQIDRHVQITKKKQNKFAFSLQYRKKEVSDKVDFLHADKCESLLQIDTMILVGMAKHSQSSQISKFAMSLQKPQKRI